MSFLNPFFWLGLAALAAPVLVHLVRRTRARRVEFPALVFVRQIPQRTIRRRTLHNLLLLVLRCLAVLLIVIAFTRPFFSDGSSAAESAEAPASVILIDASLSMRQAEHFAEAKRRAEAIIQAAQGDERLALVLFGKRYEIINRFTTDKNKVRASLANLSAGFEGTDYEQALRGAESLFNDLKGGGVKRIFLISDFQAAGWSQANATFRLRNDISLSAIDVGGDAPAANVAVTNVEARAVVYGQKYADKLAVHVSNFGDEAIERLTLDFQLNEQTVEKREISLAERDTRVVEFTGFNLAEGPNRCIVSINTDDFAPDNQFYFTLKREVPGKALIVERAVRGRTESFYLQNALTTGETLPFSFAVKSAGSVDPTEIPSFSLVVLNDAGALPGPFIEGLTKFVQAGGRLIVSLGPNSDAGGFNQAFQNLAPATINEAVRLERGESLAITDVKTDHPIFEVFQGGGRLISARIFGYHRSEPRADSSVLARFEDGSPALVETGASAKGRVLLFTSTLGTSWNDLPLTPLYLPLVQQMVRYLGERETNAWHELGQTFTVRKAPEGAPPAVDSPAGARLAENKLTPDGDLLLTGREPGFYRLRYSAQPEFAAVNVDGREGDFSKLSLDEFMAAVTGGANAADGVAATDKLSNEEMEARQLVWWPLLFVALLLLVAEALIARRTKMVKMIG
jgi:hypothetical protein